MRVITASSALALTSALAVTAWPMSNASPRPPITQREHALRTRQSSSGNTSTASLPTADALSFTVPPPVANGGKAWAYAFQRASNLTSQMTVEEKVSVITGQGGYCAGNTGNVTRLGLPGLCLQDGPTGPRPGVGSTQFPAGVTTAATWDADLIYERSHAMGQEFYDLGVTFALAPVTGGPLGRAPRGGRNWEGWYADPYATGVASYLSVKGLQDSGVVATAKHFIAYEQESSRNPHLAAAVGGNKQLPISSELDDKTTHEIYLWSFAEAVRAGVGSIMCSYNMVNGTHACQNSQAQNGLLKGELGFEGSIMSDWGGTWSTQASAEGGLDLDMPGLNYGGILGVFFDTELVDLVNNGTISLARLDDQVNRVLTPYIFSGQFDNPPPSTAINIYNDLGGSGLQALQMLPSLPFNYRLVQQDSTRDLVRKIGEDGAILLKNTAGDAGLPLKSPATIAIIGSDAGPSPFGPSGCTSTESSCPVGPDGMPSQNNGTHSVGGGSGSSFAQNLIDPLAAIQARAFQDRSRVQWSLNDTDTATQSYIAGNSEVALVFLGVYAEEGADRYNLSFTDSLITLVTNVASINNNTIVILHIPAATIVESFADNPNVTAILAPLYPGEETGNSLVGLLYGDINPNGKLPFTMAKNESDYPPNTIVQSSDISPQANFTEKLLIDYRWFDTYNITPRYEFGFGLSYTTFSMSNLQADYGVQSDTQAIQETNERFEGQADGESIYDTVATMTVDVKNTGDVLGCEVAQLYVEFPATENQPPRQLRGFAKAKQLSPGATQTLTFPIRRKDVATWDTVKQMWVIPSEAITFHVGSSSRNLPLSTSHTF